MATRWLVDFTFAGVTFRLSDAEVDVTSSVHGELHYYGVLDDVTVDLSAEYLAPTAAPSSASLSAVFPESVAYLVSQGHDLSTATCSVSRWVEGETYEDRTVLVTGYVSDPEYGSDSEPVSWSVEQVAWEGSRKLPSAKQRVGQPNWTLDQTLSLSASERTLQYPLVVGNPGKVSTSTYSTGHIAATRPVWADHRSAGGGNRHNLTLVVAGHHVTASVLFMNTDDATTPLQVIVRNGYDAGGNAIAYAPWWYTKAAGDDPFEYSGTGTYTWAIPATGGDGCIGHAGAPVSFQPGSGDTPSQAYMAWSDPTNSVGGGVSVSGRSIRSATEVLPWLLAQGGAVVDGGRWAAAAAWLDRFELDFTIDAQCSAWEFASAELLPLLPVTVVSTPTGLAPLVWRYDAKAGDAVAHLDTGADVTIERVSVVGYDSGNLINDFTLSYALSMRTGGYLGRHRYSSEPTDWDAGYTQSPYSLLSQARYKDASGGPLVREQTLESNAVYSDSTARAVCEWKVRALAFAQRRVSYSVSEEEFGWLERGAVVTVTDEELHLSEQVCLVESLTYGGGRLTLGLFLLDRKA